MKKTLVYILCTCIAVLASVASIYLQEKRAQAVPATAGNTALTGAPGIIEITDPDEIEHIWSQYIFDGTTTVYNTEFSSPAELETGKSYLVKYALQRLVKDGDVASRPSGKDLREIDMPTAEQVQSKIAAALARLVGRKSDLGKTGKASIKSA